MVEKGDRMSTKHDPLYHVWASMKQRCQNPRSVSFKHYGAKGITVCAEWAGPHSYPAFHKWTMANGYRVGLTIERKRGREGYCPENCTFVTLTENLRNRAMTPAWLAAIHKANETRRRNAAAWRAQRDARLSPKQSEMRFEQAA